MLKTNTQEIKTHLDWYDWNGYLSLCMSHAHDLTLTSNKNFRGDEPESNTGEERCRPSPVAPVIQPSTRKPMASFSRYTVGVPETSLNDTSVKDR